MAQFQVVSNDSDFAASPRKGKRIRTFQGEPLSKESWRVKDPAKFPADVKKAYNDYLNSRKATSDLRATFERIYNKATKVNPPKGTERIFGYNFGKFSTNFADIVTESAGGRAVESDF
jgi:hypothetical protein